MSRSLHYKLINSMFKDDINMFKKNLEDAGNLQEDQYNEIFKDAVDFKHLDIIKYLVEEKKIDPSFDNNCVLDVACERDFTECVDYLLKQKTVTVRPSILIRTLRKENYTLFEKLIVKLESSKDILKFGLELAKFPKEDLEKFENYCDGEKESQQKKIKI